MQAKLATATATATATVLTIGSLGLLASPAAAAATVERSATCTTPSSTTTVTFSTTDDGTPYGSVRAAQGRAEGLFLDTPAMTVRVRDGYGRVVVSRTVTDGSLSLAFTRRIGGPRWTAEATVDNTEFGPCATAKVRIAL
jgi:hypothetical protein